MRKKSEATATATYEVAGRSVAKGAHTRNFSTERSVSQRSASQLKARLERAQQRQARVRTSQAPDESGVHPLRTDRTLASGDSVGSQAAIATQLGPAKSRRSSAPEPAPAAVRTTTSWARAAAWLVSGAVVGVAVVVAVQPAPTPLPESVTPVRKPIVESVVGAALGTKPTLLRPTVEIVTEPTGAEVVYRGAVVANTPWSLPRPSHEALYLIRRTGYHPQLIRLSPHTGGSIVVSLRPVETD